ncbi:MAG: hypothetical protein CBC48_02840 [bacterium TMED88]|nr:hypothetical protein [Deltaproteobacteria bacterium]OUV36011.1 MAG: hypothetical protein CBC48_02840 [bacterium TMED88]
MSTPELDALGSDLTESFYRGLDRDAIVEAIRNRRAEGGSASDAFVVIWGIEDPALVERLIELGLTTETVAALSLTPLVEVAWADGKVDPHEREAVLDAAAQYGLQKSDISYMLLEGRLSERPAPELQQTWRSYMAVLAQILDSETITNLRGDVMARARQVAETSGGILGLGNKISKSELAKLDELEQAFVAR